MIVIYWLMIVIPGLTFFLLILIGISLLMVGAKSIYKAPKLIREFRKQHLEEQRRVKKERAYLESIAHWKDFNNKSYEMFKRNNPYRKEFYYLLNPEHRP